MDGKRKERRDLTMVLGPATHIPVRRLPFDPAWRSAVRDAMAEKELSQRSLGEFVGGSQGTISNILDDKFSHSEYVERISIALGISLPTVARLELASRVLVEAHDDEARAMLIKIVARAEQAAKKIQQKHGSASDGGDGVSKIVTDGGVAKLSPSSDNLPPRK